MDDLVAVGQSNGRVALLRLRPTTYTAATATTTTTNSVYGSRATSREDLGSVPNTLGEFLPRHSRPCNVVAFSPLASSNTTLLAAGLDKVRNDYCLLLWDAQVRFITIRFGG